MYHRSKVTKPKIGGLYWLGSARHESIFKLVKAQNNDFKFKPLSSTSTDGWRVGSDGLVCFATWHNFTPASKLDTIEFLLGGQCSK